MNPRGFYESAGNQAVLSISDSEEDTSSDSFESDFSSHSSFSESSESNYDQLSHGGSSSENGEEEDNSFNYRPPPERGLVLMVLAINSLCFVIALVSIN